MSVKDEININEKAFDKFLRELNEKLDNMNHTIANIESKPFTVLFCGGFSTGKSSLINALLGDECNLPTSILPTTKLITRIRYAPTLKITVTGKTKQYSSFKEVDEIIRGEGEGAGKKIEVQIGFPSELLKNNVELVDTPGINDDSNGILDEITKKEVNYADLVIAVFNPVKFADSKERKFLDDVNALVGGNCVSVVNCINYINTEKDFMDTEERAKSILKVYGNDIVGKGTHFFVCSERKYLDFGGFDTWLNNIIKYKADKIKQLTRYSVLSQNIQKVSLTWLDKYNELSNLYERIKENNEKNKLNQRDKLLYAVNSLWTQIINENRSMMIDLNGPLTDKINKEIDAKKGSIYKYTEKVSEALNKSTVEFFNDNVNKLIKKIPELAEAIRRYDLYSRITKAIKAYCVPEPISTRHERGLFERMADALDDVVDGLYIHGISGGKYYYTYNDYTQVTKNSFNVDLLPKLKIELEGFFDYLLTFICFKSHKVAGGLENDLEKTEIYLKSLKTKHYEIESVNNSINRYYHSCRNLIQDFLIHIPQNLKLVTDYEEVQVSVINPSDSYSLIYSIEEGSEFVDIEWGEFSGNTIPLKIDSLDKGYSKIKIFIKDQPEIYSYINIISDLDKEIMAEIEYLSGKKSEENNDFKQALSHFLKAAEDGYEEAYNEIGEYYYYGKGCKVNYIKAFEYYLRATGNHDAKAEYSIAHMYFSGIEVEKNRTAAYKWLNAALKDGSTNGWTYFMLGYCYGEGEGTEVDYTNALKYYRLAADAGIGNAMNNISILYIHGRGVTKDYKLAFEWFLKAANAGSVMGMYNVATYYENGTGTSINLSEAIKWYKKAAEQNDEDAVKALKRLNA